MLRPECVPTICPNCQHPQAKHVRIGPGRKGCTAAKSRDQGSDRSPCCPCGWTPVQHHAPRPAHLLRPNT